MTRIYCRPIWQLPGIGEGTVHRNKGTARAGCLPLWGPGGLQSIKRTNVKCRKKPRGPVAGVCRSTPLEFDDLELPGKEPMTTLVAAVPSLSISVETAVGTFQLVSNGNSITELLLPNQRSRKPTRLGIPPEVLQRASQQLRAYFGGELREFDLPLAASRGTVFQREVWDELLQIPFGQTISYGQLAEQIQRPKAVRAVGAANGQNPLPIIVPCHRVIGSNGTLTGYAGGIELKRWLLEHEATAKRRTLL